MASPPLGLPAGASVAECEAVEEAKKPLALWKAAQVGNGAAVDRLLAAGCDKNEVSRAEHEF